MRIAVPDGDKRFICLAEILRDEGHDVNSFQKQPELTICRWPPASPVNAGIAVTCGPKNAPDGMIDLLKDEDYQRGIAWMTAEGAVAAAMGRTGCAIRGAECMIVGWGRIGSALAGILCALGGKVTVLSRRADSAAEIRAIGAEYGNTADAGEYIGKMRFVFSTPPAMVLDRSVLEHACRDAAVIDLASPPYGIDMEAAQALGINAWREPGVPGRYCPENAARAIYSAIKKRGILNG